MIEKQNLKTRKVSLKTYLITIALITVILGSALVAVYANGASPPNVYLDMLPSTASYVISVDPSNPALYWSTRFDGYAYSGTNASAVITAAINNASAIKGSVLIKAGDYPISPEIGGGNYGGFPAGAANFNNTLIMGEGVGTHLYLPNNQPKTGNIDYPKHQILSIYNCENVTIENLCVDGNYINNDWIAGEKALIQIKNSRYVTVDHCWILNGRTFGVSIQAYSGEDTYGVKVTNCILRDDRWNPIECLSYGGVVHNCLVQGNIITGFCDIGIATPASEGYYSKDINIIGNMIFGNGTGWGSGTPNAGYGIRLENAIRCVVEGNTISQCNNGYSDTFGGSNLITGNTIQINTDNSGDGISIYTPNNTITDNIIYVGYTWDCGIRLSASNNDVENNHIINEGGNANSNGIVEQGNPNNNIIRNNVFVNITSPIGAIYFTAGTGQIASGNIGYNPVGVIANPVTGSTLIDSGAGTIANNTVYTNWQSPKDIYWYGGTGSLVFQVDGTTVSSGIANGKLHLEAGQTFKYTCTTAPTIVVIGQ